MNPLKISIKYNQPTIIAIFAVSLFFVSFFYSKLFVGPAYLSDEVGYLTKAAALAGYNLDFPSSWHAGYSLLLAPIFYLSGSPFEAWRYVQIFNSLLLAASFIFLHLILLRLFPKIEKKYVLIASLGASLYPTWIVMTGYSFATLAIMFFYILLIYAWISLKNNKFRQVILSLLAAFLYWIHPTGIIVFLSLCTVYSFQVLKSKGFNSEKWFCLISHILISGTLIVFYKFGMHIYLQNIMTAEGYTPTGHYPSVINVLKKTLSLDFWLVFSVMMSTQLLGVIIATLGTVSYALLFCMNYLFSTRAQPLADNTIESKQIFMFLIATTFGVLILGSLSFSHSVAPERIDLWIYGRYLEPYIYPLIGIGLIIIREKKWRYISICIVAALFFVSYISGYSPSGHVNAVNIPSFWPYALYPDEGFKYWLLLGSLIVIIINILGLKFLLVCAFPIIFISVISATTFHQNILSYYSKPDPVIYFIESNYQKGDCIGFDSVNENSGIPERRNLLAFYLYKYGFRRYELTDWMTDCNGIFITQRNIINLPENLLVFAYNSHTGISLIAQNQDINYLNFDALENTNYYYDNSGESPCLYGRCIHLSANDLGRFSQVGYVSSDGLHTKGLDGFLFFGPYSKMPAGDYKVNISITPKNNFSVIVDIVTHKGTTNHHEEIFILSLTDQTVEFSFRLKESVEDLEVRMRVRADADLSINSLSVIPADHVISH